MKIGLIGLPMTGKTMFFNLLTGKDGDMQDMQKGKTDTDIGMARIPDKRIDYLSDMYKPKKTTYACIEVTDLRGVTPGGSTGNRFLESVRQADVLVHVVGVFGSDADDSLLQDINAINTELLLADLVMIENRLERISSGRNSVKAAGKGSDTAGEYDALKKCKEWLETGRPISSLNLEADERQCLKSFNFLTERPMIMLLNYSEDQFRAINTAAGGAAAGNTAAGSAAAGGSAPCNGAIAACVAGAIKKVVSDYAAETGMPVIEACAGTELEISRLDEESRQLFMDDLGIAETGLERLASTAYDYLGMISFFTVGEDEVRAWPIRKGTSARNAAGKIHSDIEKGFIRAEVVGYSNLHDIGSMARVKEKGLFRLDGREYTVKDGDIINFRFNV